MKYQTQLTRQASKHLRKIPQKEQKIIKTVLQEMETEPFTGDVKKLSGYDAYRRRVGRYRIIYTVRESEIVILVFDILPRNEKTYKQLK